MSEFPIYYGYGNRVICNVLEEMRKCYETRNFAPLLGLIEEAQVMANRMEAGLGNIKSLEELQNTLSEARRAYKKLRAEYNELQKKKQELEESLPKKLSDET